MKKVPHLLHLLQPPNDTLEKSMQSLNSLVGGSDCKCCGVSPYHWQEGCALPPPRPSPAPDIGNLSLGRFSLTRPRGFGSTRLSKKTGLCSRTHSCHHLIIIFFFFKLYLANLHIICLKGMSPLLLTKKSNGWNWSNEKIQLT